jgi:hypothetical protein
MSVNARFARRTLGIIALIGVLLAASCSQPVLNTAPTVTTNPANQTVTVGATPSFTAAASGNPAPTVQWQVSTDNGVTFNNVAGATSATLTLTAVTLVQTGNQYRATFTNSVGTATTTTAKLTVLAAPAITSFIAGQATITAGNSTTLTAVFAGGTGSVNNSVGAVTSGTAVTITPAATTTYTLTVTNAAGTPTTATATVTVVAAPAITSFIAGQATVTAGNSTTLTAVFTGGTGSVNNGVGAVTSGTAVTITPGATTPYTLTVTNAAGTPTTAAATVTVVPLPAITSFVPGLTTITAGNTTTLTAVFTGGTGSVNNGVGAVVSGTAVNITPAVTTTYTLTVTNAAGTPTTAAATVTVNTPPAFTSSSGATFTVGSNGTFPMTATGYPTPALSMVGSLPNNVTFVDNGNGTATISGTPATGTAGNYPITITAHNGIGVDATQVFTLTVNTGPAITLSPSNQTVTAGGSVSFTAAATGTPTPTVQWQVSTSGGPFTNLTGATSTTLTFTATAAQNGNQYQAVFTNPAGSATTTAATLTVNFAPAISQNPANQTALAGTTATFNAFANGNPTPTVQWQVSTDSGVTFNNVTGANSTTLTLTSVTAGQNGYEYQAVFTNGLGSSTTSAATLTVVTDLCATSPSGHEGVLSGRWVVLLQGWQGTGPGSPVASAFSFSASGTGSFNDVTGSGVTGNIDANFGANGANSVFSSNLLTAGSSYKVGLDPTNGTGYVGCMTLANSGTLLSAPSTVSLRFALSVTTGSAVRGRIIRWMDTSGTGSGTRASGLMLPQDVTAFTGGNTANLKPNYAFGEDGSDVAGGRFAIAGTIALNTATGSASATYDTDDAGSVSANQSESSTVTGLSSTTGRALNTGTPQGSTTAIRTAIYIVNANEFFMVGIDPYTTNGPGIYSGRAIVTGTSFSNTSLSGNYVIQTYGSSTGNSSCNNSGPCANVSLGELSLSNGTINGTSTIENYQQGNAISTDHPSGTYAVAASGRVSVTAGNHSPVLYLATPQSNTEPIVAFIVGTDSSGASGEMEAGANSNVSVSTLAGNYIFGSIDPSDSTVSDQTGVVKVDSSGNVTGYQYRSDTSGLTEGSLNSGGGSNPAMTITNNPLPGFGSIGSNSVAVTDGTRLWFIDTGSTNTNPAGITIVQP